MVTGSRSAPTKARRRVTWRLPSLRYSLTESKRDSLFGGAIEPLAALPVGSCPCPLWRCSLFRGLTSHERRYRLLRVLPAVQQGRHALDDGHVHTDCLGSPDNSPGAIDAFGQVPQRP
jgi:hypothetical protein